MRVNISTVYYYQFVDGINTRNGYAALAMYTDPNNPDNQWSDILQLDANGNCMSVRTLNTGYFETGSLCGTPDGGLVAGVDYYGTDSDEIFIERSDSAGDCVWAKSYDFEAIVNKIAGSPDGGYFVAGGLYGYSLPVPFIMKTDSSGNTLWDWEDPDSGEFSDILGIENGSAIAVGYAGDDSSGQEMLAVKIDGTGKQVWRKEMKWGQYSYADGINAAAGERLGYVVSGASDGLSASGNLNMFALQIDGNGNISNIKNINSSTSVYDGYNAPISADHFILASMDYLNEAFIADYTPVVYTSVPVAGGINSDNFYVCPQPAQNYVRFVYALKSRAAVKINIYNFANRLVGQNISSELPGANVTTQLDTTRLSSGVYFYQIIETGSGGAEKRLKAGEFIIKK